MSITPICDRCNIELAEPGALLFSPPGTAMGFDLVEKFHLCKKCWFVIRKMVLGFIMEPE